ncbi:MAG: Uma2 family endonuclease [Cyanobacteria bacterium J06641_5]
MALAKEIKISSSSAPADVIFPSGEPYSNEPPLETELHLQQMILLLNCLHWLWRDRGDYFAAGNLSIYYSPRQRKSEDMRGPDFFVVLGVEKRSRRSWTVWEEGGKYPNIIVEILSDSTADRDRKLKKGIYQDIFRTPDYFWFDPDSQEFAGFHLMNGKYEPLEPNAEGWLWSEQLQLFLGIFEGQLRYFTPAGELVPTTEEVALQERQRAKLAEEEAAKEREKAQRLAARLRALGIDPDEL